MFNNIIIERTNNTTGNINQIINVPLAYAAKDKMITRLLQDANIDRPDAILLPRISFQILDFKYDTERKMNTIGTQKNLNSLTSTGVSLVYNPVPYDIVFGLYIYVKNNEDGTKIVEQILPFFTPSFDVNVFLLPGFPSLSIPIQLNSVELQDSNSEEFKDRRIQIWNLSFSLKGYFYGPVMNKPVINMTNIEITGANFIDGTDFIYNYGLDDLQDGNRFVTNEVGKDL